jgi:hypothetical protein
MLRPARSIEIFTSEEGGETGFVEQALALGQRPVSEEPLLRPLSINLGNKMKTMSAHRNDATDYPAPERNVQTLFDTRTQGVPGFVVRNRIQQSEDGWLITCDPHQSSVPTGDLVFSDVVSLLKIAKEIVVSSLQNFVSSGAATKSKHELRRADQRRRGTGNLREVLHRKDRSEVRNSCRTKANHKKVGPPVKALVPTPQRDVVERISQCIKANLSDVSAQIDHYGKLASYLGFGEGIDAGGTDCAPVPPGFNLGLTTLGGAGLGPGCSHTIILFASVISNSDASQASLNSKWRGCYGSLLHPPDNLMFFGAGQVGGL